MLLYNVSSHLYHWLYRHGITFVLPSEIISVLNRILVNWVYIFLLHSEPMDKMLIVKCFFDISVLIPKTYSVHSLHTHPSPPSSPHRHPPPPHTHIPLLPTHTSHSSPHTHPTPPHTHIPLLPTHTSHSSPHTHPTPPHTHIPLLPSHTPPSSPHTHPPPPHTHTPLLPSHTPPSSPHTHPPPPLTPIPLLPTHTSLHFTPFYPAPVSQLVCSYNFTHNCYHLAVSPNYMPPLYTLMPTSINHCFRIPVSFHADLPSKIAIFISTSHGHI